MRLAALSRRTHPASTPTRPRPTRHRGYQPRLEAFEDRVVPDVKTWTGAIDMNWSNAGNWNGGVPQPADTAVFNDTAVLSSATVDAAFAGTLAALDIQSTWGGTITLARSLTITGANSQWVSGIIAGTGTLTNSGTVTLAGTAAKTLRDITLRNIGAVIHTGTGNLTLNSATLNNQAGGAYEFRDTGGFGGGDATVNNAGTIHKAINDGTVTVGVTFNNSASGVLDVRTGTLRLANGGFSLGGRYDVAAGAVLDLTAGSTHTYVGTYTGSGAGAVLLASGTIIANNATFNFSAGLFQWTGGTVTGAGLTNSGTLTLAGTAAKSLTGILRNAGTIIHTGTGNLNLGVATLENQLGRLYEFRDTGGIGGGGFGQVGNVNNAGTVRKGVSGGTVTVLGDVNFYFNNAATGTFDVRTGMLVLGDGTSAGGTYTVAAGATLQFSGGFIGFTGTYTGSGDGTVLFATGSRLFVSATFDFPAGMFQWTGGSISGTLTNNGMITLAGSGAKGLSSTTTLRNAGTIIHTGSGNLVFNSSVLNNQATGTYEFQGTGGWELSGGTPAVDNAGTIAKSDGAGTTSIAVPVTNTGALLVVSGTLALTRPFTNAGFVLVAGSTLLVVGPYTQATGALTYLFDGALTALTVNLAEGSFFLGSGTINGNVTNTGFLFVGDPGAAGTLVVNGDYTQTAVGFMLLEIGTTASGGSDLMTVTGTAALEGIIFVDVLPSFTPREGDAFAVLSFEARGPGDPFVLVPDLGPKLILDPVFGPNGLTLRTRRP